MDYLTNLLSHINSAGRRCSAGRHSTCYKTLFTSAALVVPPNYIEVGRSTTLDSSVNVSVVNSGDF